jgi:hypothetical protein
MAGDDAWSLRGDAARTCPVTLSASSVYYSGMRDVGRRTHDEDFGGGSFPFYRGWDPGYSGLLTDPWAREARSVGRCAVESFLRCAQELGTMSLGEAVSRRS